MIEPFVSDRDLELYVGDSRIVLPELPAESVDCVVTSPPYWSLRDYGEPGQIGLEDDPLEYVASLVKVFGEAHRVLARHGTLWLNLGDTYASKPRGSDVGWEKSRLTNPGLLQKRQVASLRSTGERHRGKVAGLKEKDLCMIPARVALALQEEGWWLRSEIIWAKPNPMPASMTDRPTVSHEHVWLLAKSPRYYFDQEAVREPAAMRTIADTRQPFSYPGGAGGGDASRNGKGHPVPTPQAGRNLRTVWTIPISPFGGDHYAAFPPELARRCVKAGCPPEVCRTCGEPRERIVERGDPILQADTWSATGAASYDDEAGGYVQSESSSTLKHVVPTTTIGWTDCGHGDYRRGVVLDPFLGAGTTALVARELERHCVGVELKPTYAGIIADRSSQQSLLA